MRGAVLKIFDPRPVHYFALILYLAAALLLLPCLSPSKHLSPSKI
jgi:hypothetical protein